MRYSIPIVLALLFAGCQSHVPRVPNMSKDRATDIAYAAISAAVHRDTRSEHELESAAYTERGWELQFTDNRLKNVLGNHFTVIVHDDERTEIEPGA